MPFDPSKPFAVVSQPEGAAASRGFDPAKPFKVATLGLTDEAQSFINAVRSDKRLSDDEREEIEDEFRSTYQSAANEDPTLGQRFARHFKKGFFEESLLGSSIRRASANPTAANFKGMEMWDPALDAHLRKDEAETRLKAEEDARRWVVEYYRKRALRVAGFEGMPNAEGALEIGAAAVGRIGGGAASPETLVPVSRAGGFAVRALKQAGANVGLGLAVEPAIQSADIAEGRQDEFSSERAAIGALFNAVAGVGFESLNTGVRKALDRFRAKPQAERTPESLRALVAEEVKPLAKSPEEERAAAEMLKRIEDFSKARVEQMEQRFAESETKLHQPAPIGPRKAAQLEGRVRYNQLGEPEARPTPDAPDRALEQAADAGDDELASLSPQARRMYERYGGVDPDVMLALGAASLRGIAGGSAGYALGETPEEKAEFATFGAVGGALASRKLAKAVARRLGFKDAPEIAPLSEVSVGGRVRADGEVFTINRKLDDGGVELLDANNQPLVIPRDKLGAAVEVVSGLDRRAERASVKLKDGDDTAVDEAASVVARDAIPAGEVPDDAAVKAAVEAKFGTVPEDIVARVAAKVREYFAGRFEMNTPEVFDADAPASKETVDKLAKELRAAKRLVGKTEKLQHEERTRRASKLYKNFEELSGAEAFRAGKQTLQGELPRADFEAIADRFSDAEMDALFDHIRTHRSLSGKPHTRQRAGMVLEAAMRYGALPARSDIVVLEQIFGPKVASAMLGKQTPLRRTLDAFGELINVPRTVLSSFDLSAPLRQGFSVTVSHPKLAARAMAAQLRAFANRDYAVAMDRSLRSGPESVVRNDAGLELPSVEGFASEMSSREEAFMSRLFQKIAHVSGKTKVGRALLAPIKFQARGVAASERAYVTYLNRMRADVFDLVDRQLQEAGLTEEVLWSERRKLAKFINAATGRGNVPTSEWANALFFSPKFLVSRFEAPMRQAANAIGSKGALRKEAVQQLAAQAATWTSLFTLGGIASEAFGWDIEFGIDPRSDDFLKYTVDGKTTVDFGGGYGPAVRLIARLATGEAVSSSDGKEKRVQVAGEVGRFLRYKLAPVPSAVVSAIEGKTIDRREATAGALAADLTLPISFQTLDDVTREHGATGLMLMIPEILGAGINVRQPERKRGSMFSE